jgi:hypothetical protein
MVGLYALLVTCGTSLAQVSPLPNAHAHNDYVHERPLFDALDHGFCSVEADIHLVDGQLLVAHDLVDTTPSRTLQSLYLEPLRQRIAEYDGSVYAEQTPVTLLIDIKSDAEATYSALHDLLRSYADILTIYAGDVAIPGPVQAIISGNRARETMRKAEVRFASFDGRLPDLLETPDAPATFMPLISSNWSDVGGSAGMPGRITQDGLIKLRRAVTSAHEQGRRIRFWATGDHPETWSLLLEEGVDLLNADDLSALETFLHTHGIDQ